MQVRALPWLVAVFLLIPLPVQAQSDDDTETVLLWASSFHGLRERGCYPTAYGFAAVAGCRVQADFPWGPGFDGTLVLNAAWHPDFSCFAAGLTNGVDNILTAGSGLGSTGQETYWRHRESGLGLGSPDLQGYLIDDLRMVVNSVSCSDLHAVRWEIWGQEDVGQPIAAIATSTRVVYPHEPISLLVSLTRADAAALEPGFGAIEPVDGTFEVVVPNPTTFVLTATNATSVETYKLTVVPARPRVEFSSESTEVFAGRETVLAWSVEGALDIEIDPDVGGGLAAVGSAVVVPTANHTTYTLRAHNGAGTEERQVTIDWKLPEARMATSPSMPFPGDTIDLYILVAGADAMFLEPGIGPLEPVDQILSDLTIDGPTTFVLTATNALGSTTATLQIREREPYLELTADPVQPRAGEPVTVDVRIQGAETASLAPFFESIPPSDATYVVEVTKPTHVVLSATNATGTSTEDVSIVPWPIVHFSVDPVFVEPGKTVEVSWEVLPFAEATLEPFGALPSIGTRVIRPWHSMTLTLEAAHEAIQQSAAATVFLGSEDGSTIELHFSDQGLLPGAPPLVSGVPFDLFVHALRPDAGVAAYEFSLEYSDCLQAAGHPLQPDTIDVGIGNDNWIVGLRECELDEVFTPLVQYTFLAPDDDCLHTGVIRIRPSTPSSFDPSVPGYLTCGYGGEIREFLPFYVPPPLKLATAGTLVPVWSIPLRAIPVASGIELEWGELDVDTQSLTLLRFEGDGVPAAIAHLVGEEAATSRGWLDPVFEGTYRYRVVVDMEGTELASEIVEATAGGGSVRVTSLLPNVPNPFNPSTEIRYQLASPATVHLDIFNVAGRRIRTEVMARQPAGVHAWSWDGTAQDGGAVGSGVYYIRLQAHGKTYTRQMALLR